MPYSEAARRYARDILEKRRLRCGAETDRRRELLFSRIPELRALEAEASKQALHALRCAVADKKPDLARREADRLSALQKKQAAILRENGLEEDALQPIHRCAQCGDLGVLPDGRDCDCAKALMRAYTMEEIGRVSPLALSEFESFSLDYYATEPDAETGAVPRRLMRENLELCRRFADEFPCGGQNLLLLGDSGLGKTHLALSIANVVLQKGAHVVYCSAASIFKQIENEHFRRSHESSTLDSLKGCDLLVLDDLGAEFNTPFVTATLYDLINTRFSERRSTIFTTNYIEEDALSRRYGEKISSRLVGCCTVLPFIGEDIRPRLEKRNR